MAYPVTLGNLHFDTQAQARAFFKAMLARYQAGDIVNDDDAVHLHHLIERHVEAPQKIGCGIARFYVDMTPKGTRCFWLERTDGSCTDFSYISCIRSKATSLDQAFKEACHEAVADDLTAAKQAHFEKYSDAMGRVPCDITGILLLPHESHLDHANPLTFEVIVTTFRKATGIEPDPRILSDSQDQQFATTFTDAAVAQRFREYHNSVAQLRIIQDKCNLSLGGLNRIKKLNRPVIIR